MKTHRTIFGHLARLAVGLLLLPAIGCAPKVYSTFQKSYPARPEGSEVKVFYLDDPVPADAEVLGRVEVRDEGTATNCGYTSVVQLAREATNRIGGDALHITWHQIPSFRSGTCHQIAGDMLRLGNSSRDLTTPLDETPAAGPDTLQARQRVTPQPYTPNTPEALPGRSFAENPFTLAVNAGYGMIVSKMEMLDGLSGNPRTGLNINAALQWTSRIRMGVGLRYSGYFSGVDYDKLLTTGRLKLHVHYIAPELILRQQAGKRWNFHETIGFGYASYGESIRGITASINGFGTHLNIGADYRLSKHIALGLGLATYRSFFPNQEILSTDEETTAGITFLTINGGLRILF